MIPKVFEPLKFDKLIQVVIFRYLEVEVHYKLLLSQTKRKKEKKVDRRKGNKTILNERGWILLAQLGQLKTGGCGKGLL